MDKFIASIQASLESENWLAALFMSLAMPDICRSVERPVIGRGEIGHWYKDWVSRYIEHKYIGSRFEGCNFYAEDFWLYRCSCLHAGMDAESKKRMMKFNFTPPIPGSGLIHQNLLGDRLQLQVDIFCRDMLDAVRIWMGENEADPVIQARMKELIQINPAKFNSFIQFE